MDTIRTLWYYRVMRSTTPTPGSLDLAGLPDEAIRAIESLVSLITARSILPAPVARPSPEEWTRNLLEWASSHPQLVGVLDDSREGIYARRGE